MTYVFAIYLGLSGDDLVEIKVQAESQAEATSKVKSLLNNHIDTRVTGLYMNDVY